MSDLETELGHVLRELADAAPHHETLAAAVRSKLRRRRAGMLAAAAASIVAVVAGPLWWADHRSQRAAHASPSACAGSVAPRLVPEWARTGFSDPEPVIPYAVSHSGDLVAILFGSALYAPPSDTVGNKVLAVPRLGGSGPLHIHAHLEGTDVIADVDLPDGAGPSYVNMPRAGCWRMDLAWASYHDTIDLPYVTPPPSSPSPS